MLENYSKLAYRTIIKNKIYSVISIGGLAIGMTASILIGLWIYDELSFNKYHQNYDTIAKIKRRTTWDGQKWISDYQVMGLGTLLRETYRGDFKYAVMVTEAAEHTISLDSKAFNQTGAFMQPEATELLTLTMLYGSRKGLRDMNSILLSESLAKKLFGDSDPLDKTLVIRTSNIKVTGVYKDIPLNSEFAGTSFIAPFDLFVSFRPLNINDWKSFNNVLIYVQTFPKADIEKLSARIKDLMLPHIDKKADTSHPELFLHPMSKWHLYSKFENGVIVTSEELKFIWFYGIIGAFVLMLACVNFMSLSTAISESRAKEVGIRKAVGSLRYQLLYRFLCESVLIAAMAFVIALFVVQLILPWFNGVAEKEITLLITNPMFWFAGIGFTILTGLLAG